MLADAWVEWLAENLLRGADPEEVTAALVAQGVDPDVARTEVATARSSPLLAGARRLVGRSAGVEQAARLRRALERTSPLEHDAMDDDHFHRVCFAGNRPAVMRGVASSWPAAGWTHAGLARRFGGVDVEALVGRTQHAHWWREREALRTPMSLAELCRCCVETRGDDVYAVGRNEVLATAGLEPLHHELGPLPGVVHDAPHARMWMGPAGTKTPLHHDQSSAWLVQLEGRKRVWLASPLEPALLTTALGLFNSADPSHPPHGELAEVHWTTVDLAPGDAVFLPVGWWHQVVALDPSISVSLGGFPWPNAFPWYAPGR